MIGLSVGIGEGAITITSCVLSIECDCVGFMECVSGRCYDFTLFTKGHIGCC